MPWPPNPPFEDQQPLSDLGHFADNTYKLGPMTLADYYAQLDQFIDVGMPKSLRKHMHQELDRYLKNNDKRKTPAWDGVKSIWQTDKDEKKMDKVDMKSWRDGPAKEEGWSSELVTDALVCQACLVLR